MKKKILPLLCCILLILLVAAVPAGAKTIFKIGGDVAVERDQKVDTVFVIGGQVTVSGLIDHNVFVIGGSVVLTNYAVVQGDVVCVGGVIVKGNTAQVFGDITEINSANISAAIASALRGETEGWSLIFNIISLCFFTVIFIIALLVTVFIPRPLNAIAGEIQEHKVKSFIWGILATLMIVPFFMLLVISIIGITLIPLVFTLLLLAFILGYIAAGDITGNFILAKISKSPKSSLPGATLLGLTLLWLIGWIPYIGWLVKISALTFGLGGVFLTLFNRRRRPIAPPPVNEEPVQPASE